MADTGGQEKTEDATQKKLTDARDKGQSAKSTEINSLGIFLTGFVVLYISRHYIAENVANFSRFIFSSLDVLELNMTMVNLYAFKGLAFYVVTLAPIFLGLVLMSFVVGYGQVGFKITPKALEPKFSKLNPIQGIKSKLFSSQAVVELIKSIFKLVIIGTFIYWMLSDLIAQAIGIIDYSIPEILNFMIEHAFSFVYKTALLFTIIAVADLTFQRFKFKKDQKMTKQEIQDETKQTDGDPYIKGKIKGKQLEMARSRMMDDIPSADVVVTNPTHFAVALKYEAGTSSAPKIVAKGMDSLARRIKKIATESGVPLHEDVQLARALYASCEVGEDIPEKLFTAVAKILAFIFQQKNNKPKTIV